MGSSAMQGQLWGKQAENWALIQEQTANEGYQFALRSLRLHSADSLLDVGCGSGLFTTLAAATGASVTGIDASAALLAQAKKRNPAGVYLVGEMEELPFADKSFTVVTGFNSFQYAANVKNALIEAGRVLKDKGRLVVMIWGNKEDCQAASYLKAVGSLLPPPPPGAPGPFALSENHLLETTLEDSGFGITSNTDLPSVWDYPDTDTALKGLLSAGPAARAIDHSGYEKVVDTVSHSLQPYILPNGHIVYHNKFRVVVAEKR